MSEDQKSGEELAEELAEASKQHPELARDPNSGAVPQPGGYGLGGTLTDEPAKAAPEPDYEEPANAPVGVPIDKEVEPTEEVKDPSDEGDDGDEGSKDEQKGPEVSSPPQPEDADPADTDTATREQELQNQATPADEAGVTPPRKKASKTAAKKS